MKLFLIIYYILFFNYLNVHLNKKEKERKRKLFEKYDYKKINLIKKKIVKNKKII